MKLRRARGLVMFWHSGELVIENYLAPRSTDEDQDNALATDPVTVELLSRFEEWTEADDVAATFDGHDPASVIAAIAQLREVGLLRAEDEAEREDRFEHEWRHLSTEARYFHFGTKDAVYVGDWEEARRQAAQLAAASGPPPPIFKTYPDAPRVYLPRDMGPIAEPLGDVLRRRRTVRDFKDQPVDVRTLSSVLHYSFGPMHFVEAYEWGPLFFRTSPSGGARQELECYVGVLNVDGLEPGLYHYCVENHSLELVNERFDREIVDRLTFGQRMCLGAGFVCFLTALFERATYKYRHPRTYRMVMLDAGHLAQTFVLTCTALGLGAFQTAAFRDSEVECALGLDGFAEAALYLVGAGHAARPVDGRPLDLPPATPTRRRLTN
jgi:SagB-type dehydrogenase family enzyme